MSERIDNEASRLAQEPFMQLVRELVWTFQSFECTDRRHLRELGFTQPQFDVLAALGNTDGMRLSTLAEKTLLAKSSLTGVVDRLVRRGLVERRYPAADRRCVQAVLTEAGEAAFHDVFPRHLRFMRRRFDVLTDHEQHEIRASLRKLRGAFETTQPGEEPCISNET